MVSIVNRAHTILFYGHVLVMFLAPVLSTPSTRWYCCRFVGNKFHRLYRLMNLLFLRLINIFTVHKFLKKAFCYHYYTTFPLIALQPFEYYV